MTDLEILMNYKNYKEDAIEQAIINLWPCIFREYELLTQSQLKSMVRGWKPDIVTYDYSNDFVAILELKSSKTKGSLQDALNQAIRYGRHLYVDHQYSARLLIIGKWKTNRFIDHYKVEGHTVGVLNIGDLADQLLFTAEKLLMWVVESPFPLSTPLKRTLFFDPDLNQIPRMNFPKLEDKSEKPPKKNSGK